MNTQQYVSFAVSVIDTFAGDFDHLHQFLDSVRVIKEVTDAKNQDLFLHIVKSRISGPARAFIPKYCSCVDEIITCLETNIEPDSARAIEAKLRVIAKDIYGDVAVVRFVEEAERLVDKLVYTYIAQGQLVNMAKSNAINMCARIFNVTPELVSSPREMLHKYLDSVTHETWRHKEQRVYA